jgi:biopolymer transport protein ExbB
MNIRLLEKKFLAILCPLFLLLTPLYSETPSPAAPLSEQETISRDASVEKSRTIINEKNNQSIKPKIPKNTAETSHGIASLNLKEIFSAAPVIYTILFLLSILAFTLWLYAVMTFRTQDPLLGRKGEELKRLLLEKKFDLALVYCQSEKKSIIAKLLHTAISARHLGAQYMVEAMKAEGKRAVSTTWQKISLLNDIVIVAPMLGLLGTVLGMFYAFYDLNRSAETLSSLFDGLGIAVGSTVTGLIVAILSMLFATTLKYRTMKALALIENEAITLSNPLLAKDNP